MQVPVDTNMIFRTEDIHNNYGMLEYVRAKYPEHQIIVKKHPADGFTCPEKLQAYCDEHGLTLVNMATHSLLQIVDHVVSVNSQVIVEAWMHGLRPEILGQPAFDMPDEPDKEALLYTLRFSYYIEPWQLTERLKWIANSNG
jgi:capsule polysaccharide export protein KpsC/LpsZ